LQSLADQLNGPQRQALLDYIALLDAIPSERTTTVRTVISGRGTSGGVGPVPHAAGGVVGSNEPLSLVGERGPEYVSLPPGSRVHAAPQTRQMGGRGQIVLNNPVFNNGTDIDSFAAAMNMKLRLM
jgi:hypothetical protein